MDSIRSKTAIFLHYFLLIVTLTCHVSTMETNQTFKALDEMHRMKIVKEYLQNINKHVKKTIMSPDDDIIDCILFHKQPTFDHPLLKGNISMEPPKRTNEIHSTGEVTENFQLWHMNGEKCPHATIPMKRIREEDVLRAPARLTTNNLNHEHAIASMPQGKYFGAKASLNVWAPRVTGPQEFSLSQIWVSAGQQVDTNTIEVGWHVFPLLNGDDRPRFFVYWTADGYKTTGCYNLHCPGFVHTNPRIALGGTISPVSTYNGSQYEFIIKVEKVGYEVSTTISKRIDLVDPNSGNWLLLSGSNNEEIGYWPSQLFTHLKDSATMVRFGGEIVDQKLSGAHTATEMGSGHFAGEKFRKAAYMRNLVVFGWGNQSAPLDGLRMSSDRPNCYNIQLVGTNKAYGTHFYFGGPGLGNRCH